jgi:aquaglyceroporin related protein
LLVIFAVTDKRSGTPAGFVPLIVFITIIGIGTSLGMQTGKVFMTFYPSFHPITSNLIIAIGFALNPARDLGPRIMTAMVGYGRQGTGVLSYFN